MMLEFHQHKIYKETKALSEVYPANYLCYKRLAMKNTFVEKLVSKACLRSRSSLLSL